MTTPSPSRSDKLTAARRKVGEAWTLAQEACAAFSDIENPYQDNVQEAYQLTAAMVNMATLCTRSHHPSYWREKLGKAQRWLLDAAKTHGTILEGTPEWYELKAQTFAFEDKEDEQYWEQRLNELCSNITEHLPPAADQRYREMIRHALQEILGNPRRNGAQVRFLSWLHRVYPKGVVEVIQALEDFAEEVTDD